jgi:hypothetical protein
LKGGQQRPAPASRAGSAIVGSRAGKHLTGPIGKTT